MDLTWCKFKWQIQPLILKPCCYLEQRRISKAALKHVVFEQHCRASVLAKDTVSPISPVIVNLQSRIFPQYFGTVTATYGDVSWERNVLMCVGKIRPLKEGKLA